MRHSERSSSEQTRKPHPRSTQKCMYVCFLVLVRVPTFLIGQFEQGQASCACTLRHYLCCQVGLCGGPYPSLSCQVTWKGRDPYVTRLVAANIKVQAGGAMYRPEVAGQRNPGAVADRLSGAHVVVFSSSPKWKLIGLHQIVALAGYHPVS